MSQKLSLNGFELELSSQTFTAQVRDMPNTKGLRTLRERLRGSWFVYWRGGQVFGLPLVPQPEQDFGEPVELTFEDHPQLVAARINDVLPEKFPNYQAFRRRPFTFLGKRNEIVALSKANLGGMPDVLDRFKIWPRFELDARLVELREGETFVGVFVRAGTRWEIKATLGELKNEGVDLKSLYVVRRNPQLGERRLVGRIGDLVNHRVELSESFDEIDVIDADEVWIEGSRASFARCLKHLLGPRYQQFEEERDRQETRLLTCATPAPRCCSRRTSTPRSSPRCWGTPP